ncbi:SubName: Full=Uncharacterized protein {ECO:0000313/EMBL:ENI11109.1} [Serendipita indica DSM 11827]|nr:SubName: Full=Uncharacterized protein {ECO:0000313/EMBL:ENI11109.1} [Serendipita indica DSM 11827]
MSSTWSAGDVTLGGSASREFDDAEKGVYENMQRLPILPPRITPTVSNPMIPLKPEAACPRSPPAEKPSEDKPVQKKPPPPKRKVSRWILFQLWFNTYRKFFTFVTLLNLAGIIMAALNRFPYAEKHLGALVLGNLLCAILMRNELFLRFLYLIAIHGLRGWAPISIKLAVTSILQHVGGIHSGCALSGAAWLVFKIVDIIRHHKIQHDAVIVTGIITSILVIISIISAFPWVRNTHHNVFERHHRFIGWLGLAATWIFVILGNTYDIKTRTWRTDGDALISAQEFWFALGMTVFVLIPWVTVREVPVDVEIPSPKVAVIRFHRGMQQGLLGRISRSSIMEYHAFGIISEGKRSRYHYMICGVQGDFTKGLVTNPPKTLWTRELKFAGVGHASAMFNRGIQRQVVPYLDRLRPEKTFGPTITGLIRKHIEPERMILWDSKKRGGRPDTMQLLKDTWKSWGAEVIFITSNMQGNDEMMQGCREAGMHAFGTLWDF